MDKDFPANFGECRPGRVVREGDQVRVTRHLAYGLIKAGSLGTVVRKFTPGHAVACWTITVDFHEPRWCPIEFEWPGAPIEPVD